MNAKAPARAVRRTKAIQWQAMRSDLHRIHLMANIDNVQVAEWALLRVCDLIRGENDVGSAAMLGHDDPDAVRVAFFRWRPFDLADLCRFFDIANIENDDALISIGEVSAVFVHSHVVQRD